MITSSRTTTDAGHAVGRTVSNTAPASGVSGTSGGASSGPGHPCRHVLRPRGARTPVSTVRLTSVMSTSSSGNGDLL